MNSVFGKPDPATATKPIATTRKTIAAAVLAAVAAAALQPAMAAQTAGAGTRDADLRGVTQNWDKVLPSEPGAGCPNWSTRFTCVMNNAAVRDNETGLVWAQPLEGVHAYHDAQGKCLNLTLGNRKGWRLPSVTELASLLDMGSSSQFKVPANWPFIFQKTPGVYWTSTVRLGSGYSYPFVVYFETGAVPESFTYTPLNVWCVRGGATEGVNYNQ